MESKNLEYFGRIKDPRCLGMVVHQLEDVLSLALYAVICDCNGWDEMHEFAIDRVDELKKAALVSQECGIPSADTFERVLKKVDPEALRNALELHSDRIREDAQGLHIAIDGKKLRGTEPSLASTERGLYILNAFVGEKGICVGQVDVSDKSNEITAIPKMLDSLNIYKAMVTIDAIGTQYDIAETIHARGGFYVMSLKRNQLTLFNNVEMVFQHNPIKSTFSEESKGHGRVDTRTYEVMGTKALEEEGTYKPWPGLKTLIRVTRKRFDGLKRTSEISYYLSNSNELDAQYYAKHIRGHWAVENNLHWMLDVVFDEDECRIRKGFAPQNMATLRKLGLQLLKNYKDKRSVAQRRHKCARNFSYFFDIVKKG